MNIKNKLTAIKDILFADIESTFVLVDTDKGLIKAEKSIEIGNAVSMQVDTDGVITYDVVEDGDYVYTSTDGLNKVVITISNSLITAIVETEIETPEVIDAELVETAIEVPVVEVDTVDESMNVELEARVVILEEMVIALDLRIASLEAFITTLTPTQEAVDTQLRAIETKLAEVSKEPVTIGLQASKSDITAKEKRSNGLDNLISIRKSK